MAINQFINRGRITSSTISGLWTLTVLPCTVTRIFAYLHMGPARRTGEHNTCDLANA